MHESRTLASGLRDCDWAMCPKRCASMRGASFSTTSAARSRGRRCPGARPITTCCARRAAAAHATVAYFGDKLSPDDAAFLNSTFNHANETDDTHLKSPTHPGGIAVPAALALAEYAKAGGDKLLLAVIAAYEIQIRISWACSPYLIYRGHHPPVGVGPFGAAMAGAVLMGFDREETLNALAIAGSHSAGLIEYTKTGGSVKRIHSAIPTQPACARRCSQKRASPDRIRYSKAKRDSAKYSRSTTTSTV